MSSKRSLGFRPPGVPKAADSPGEQLDHPERVILKVVEAGKEKARYVNMRQDAKGLSLTSDPGEALRFRFDPQSDPKLLECVVRARLFLILGQYIPATPFRKTGQKTILLACSSLGPE